MSEREVKWPAWSLLGDASYTPSHATDLTERFRKVRAKQERDRLERERREAEERDAEQA
jgi:hypothetical protein